MSARPLVSGFLPEPRAGWLATLRFVLILLGSAPALLIALGQARSAASKGYFASVEGPLPWDRLAALAIELGPGILAASGLSLVVVLVGQSILLAGAARWLDAPSLAHTRLEIAGFIIREGTPPIWAMLRVLFFAALVAVIGLRVLDVGFGRLSTSGLRAGWDTAVLQADLPLLQALLSALWLALVGAAAFWCRLILAVDGRRRLRSVALLVLRSWWRGRGFAPLAYVLVVLSTQAVLAAVLASWRQSPPVGAVSAFAWLATYSVVLWLQCYLWQGLVRGAVRAYGSPALARLRAAPDEPWYLLKRLLRRPVPDARLAP